MQQLNVIFTQWGIDIQKDSGSCQERVTANGSCTDEAASSAFSGWLHSSGSFCSLLLERQYESGVVATCTRRRLSLVLFTNTCQATLQEGKQQSVGYQEPSFVAIRAVHFYSTALRIKCHPSCVYGNELSEFAWSCPPQEGMILKRT